MKNKVLAVMLVTIMIAGCKENFLLEDRNDGMLISELSGKPVLAKVSYIENSQRSADFLGVDAFELGLSYLEEVKIEKKQVYFEIYDDFSIGKQVTWLPIDSKYPDPRTLPADMPDVKRFTYVDGSVNGYDQGNNLIYENSYELQYFLNINEFDSQQEAIDFLIASFYNPKKNAQIAINAAKVGADSYIELSESVIEFTQAIPLDAPIASNARLKTENQEVVSEKTYMLPDYGLVYRIEGYNSEGEIKDMEHRFFTFNEDSVMYLKSSHYRNMQYSNAYDISFLEQSDSFYENFKVETSSNN